MEEIRHYTVWCEGQSLLSVNVSTRGGVVSTVVRHLMRLEAEEREVDSGDIQPSVHLVPRPRLTLLASRAGSNLIMVGRCRTDRLLFQQMAVSTAKRGPEEPTCIIAQQVKLLLRENREELQK